MKKTFSTILLILSIITASFSAYKLYESYTQYQKASMILQEVQQHITTTVPQEKNEEVEVPQEEVIEVDFPSLKMINEDIFAWIKVPGTNISYPILQSYDNEYYLYRLMDRKWNNSGSIYLDYRNTQDFSDIHSIIYGHHMKNGTMFAGLIEYKDQSFYEEHPSFYIITPEKKIQINVFAAYNILPPAYTWQMEFDNDADYQAWISATIEASSFIPKMIPTIEDRVITLSTCDYNQADERFVVVGYIAEETLY